MAYNSKCALATGIAAFTLVLSSPASALDGEILIDQAAALAGGVTPGDTLGFPVTISRRASFKLTGPLSVPANQNGIEVRAPGVTLDLNGHVIRSDPPFQANIGVDAQPTNVENLTVMNGTVVEFRFGGVSIGGGNAVVENVRAIFNGVFGIQATSDARIVNSTVASNGNFGISCSFRCIVQDSIVTGTANGGLPGNGRGIIFGSGVVVGNVIVGNAGVGLGASVDTGFGNNVLFANNGGRAQQQGALPLHPNICNSAPC